MDGAHTALLALAKIASFSLQGVWLSSVLSIFFLAASAALYSPKKKRPGAPPARGGETFFSVVIPAYAEGEVLLDCVASLERQNYPREKIRISVVADKVAPALIGRLRDRNAAVYCVDFRESTKIKALKYFMEHDAPGGGDYVVVLDADNVCHTDFLREIDVEIKSGFRVIQGKRIAKNQDTVVARLDAIAEYNGNFLFRRSTLFLHTSCALIGSGYAIERELFRGCLLELPDDVKGEDKSLQVGLGLRGGEWARIKYCEEAVCYDEKTRIRASFLTQRARWLAAYLQHLPQAAFLLRRAAAGYDGHALFMGLCQAIPPYSWICGLTLLLFASAWIFGGMFLPAGLYLGILAALWAVPMCAMRLEKAGRKMWIDYFFFAPLFVLLFLRSTFNLNLSRGQFLHTQHGVPSAARGVLHIIRQLEYGGGEQYVKNLAVRMNGGRFIPHVIGYRGGIVSRQLAEYGIPCEIINLNPLALPRIIRYIRTKKISLVHCHGTKGALLGGLAAKAAGVPFIYTEHGWSFHAKQSFLRHKCAVMAENVICLLADRVICVAGAEVSEMKALAGIDPGKVRLIENGVDTGAFDPGRSRGESAPHGTHDKLVAAMIGRVTIQKDPGCFLAVAKMFKNDPRFEFWMVGDGDLLENARRKKDEEGLNNLSFYPPTDDAAGLLSKIDCLVIPSFWEAGPLSLLEGMAMRKVCIAADVGLARKVIEDGKTGFLVHRLSGVPLAEQIAVKIRDLAASPALREGIGSKARDIMIKGYRIEGVIEKVQTLYEELV